MFHLRNLLKYFIKLQILFSLQKESIKQKTLTISDFIEKNGFVIPSKMVMKKSNGNKTIMEIKTPEARANSHWIRPKKPRRRSLLNDNNNNINNNVNNKNKKY